MAEALNKDEIDQLLAGADKAVAAIKEAQKKSYEVDVHFEYDLRELEKIKNLLIGLGEILPEIITDKFLNKAVKKWVKKYLKIHLGRMKKSEE